VCVCVYESKWVVADQVQYPYGFW